MSDFLARIKPKRSTVSGEVPSSLELEVGELAISTADAKLFTKHTDGTIKTISGSGGGGGSIEKIEEIGNVAGRQVVGRPGVFYDTRPPSVQGGWDLTVDEQLVLNELSQDGTDVRPAVAVMPATGTLYIASDNVDYLPLAYTARAIPGDGTVVFDVVLAGRSVRSDAPAYFAFDDPYVLGPSFEGDILQFDATEEVWNPTPMEVTKAADVDAPLDGYALVWDDSKNKFVPGFPVLSAGTASGGIITKDNADLMIGPTQNGMTDAEAATLGFVREGTTGDDGCGGITVPADFVGVKFLGVEMPANISTCTNGNIHWFLPPQSLGCDNGGRSGNIVTDAKTYDFWLAHFSQDTSINAHWTRKSGNEWTLRAEYIIPYNGTTGCPIETTFYKNGGIRVVYGLNQGSGITVGPLRQGIVLSGTQEIEGWGDVMKTTGQFSWQLVPAETPGRVTRDLADVSDTPPADGQILKYNAEMFVYEPADIQGPKLVDLEDVDATGVKNGESLMWDTSLNMWKPGSFELKDGDPYFSLVDTLLPFDGLTDGQNDSFPDLGNKTYTFTAGDAEGDTSLSKFGSSCLSSDESGTTTVQLDIDELARQNFTIECWLYYNNANRGAFAKYIQVGSYSAAYDSVILERDNNRTTTSLKLTNNSSTLQNFNFEADAINTWQHVALVRNGDSFLAFFDGNLQGEVTASGFNLQAPWIRFGTGCEGISEFRFTRGVARYTESFVPPMGPFPRGGKNYAISLSTLDDVDTTKKPSIPDGSTLAYSSTFKEWIPGPSIVNWEAADGDLYASDVSVLLNLNNNLDDQTGKQNALTTDANPIYLDGQFAGTKALKFSGNQVLKNFQNDDGSLNFPGDFTMEFWVKWDGTSGDMGLLSKRDRVGASAGTWGMVMTDGNWSWQELQNITKLIPSKGLTANVWSHVAVCRSGDQVVGYQDGERVGSMTCDLNLTNTKAMNFGSWDTTGRYFYGLLQDLRITKGVARYTSDFTPPNRLMTLTGVDLVGTMPIDKLTDVDTTTTAPADGQVLVYDAASKLWKPGTVQSGGGGGGAVRATAEITSSVSAAADWEGELVGLGKAGMFLDIEVDGGPAWVRFYTTDFHRMMDADRAMNRDPDKGSGVLLELITTLSSEYSSITPAVNYFNLTYDGMTPTPEAKLYFSVRNLGTSTSTIKLTVNGLVLEQ